METILLHGLGQDETSWDIVRSQLLESGIKTNAPNIFSLVKERPLTYQALYIAFEKYCNRIEGKINLIGLSLGAILAVDYTIKFPDRVNSLVLIGAPYKVSKSLIAIQNIIFYLMPKKMFTDIKVSKENVLSLMNSMKDISISDKIESIYGNVLILCGSQDRANKKSANQIHSQLKDSQLLFIQDAGHEVNIDKPIALAKILYDYFRE